MNSVLQAALKTSDSPVGFIGEDVGLLKAGSRHDVWTYIVERCATIIACTNVQAASAGGNV